MSPNTRTADELLDDDMMVIDCDICSHTTRKSVRRLKFIKPSPTLDHLRLLSTCEACGSNAKKRPGQVRVRFEPGGSQKTKMEGHAA